MNAPGEGVKGFMIESGSPAQHADVGGHAACLGHLKFELLARRLSNFKPSQATTLCDNVEKILKKDFHVVMASRILLC